MSICVAVPVEGDALCLHFGGAPAMAFFEVDPQQQAIRGRADHPTPDHAPGVLPRWVAERGADYVICGGIGERAIIMLAEAGIRTVPGAAAQPAAAAVQAWLDGMLETDPQACRHDHHAH